ncbi:MAG TPA: beta-ketoacyl synthase N-terminal-like domain-containing protein [Thermoanaerobaculia bacterium]|jgi:3-oxoacyl-[acyl-carrier-protein] synthase II|nr:beta-ketoacyl synthase N-terminal-like domain-containing protein [Thermoanaerobaculia bacterium]
MTRVAVTGIGVVAPGATGVGAFRSLLAGGLTAVTEVDRFDVNGLRGRHAALVRDFNAREFIAPMKMRRMNVLSRMGVAAAKMAFDDATRIDPATTGVAIGTTFGPVQTSVDYMREYVEKGASLAPPQLFAESVANAPGSHIAIEWGLRGFNVTVTQRESSALAAAMHGASQIVKGAATAAVIGGVEEVNEMIFSVLDRLGALGNESRPFDGRRGGLVPGEGSAMLVAQAEAKEAYGYLAGFGIARDTTATISDWGDDHHALVTAMRGAIDDAGLTMEDIDAIYASANSTRRADRVEYRAIQELFDDAAPPVVATKGFFGEYAAGGALQLVAALLAIDEQALHPSCGFNEGDPEMRIEVVRERRPANLRNVLVNSVSAGGGIVCAVVSREAA